MHSMGAICGARLRLDRVCSAPPAAGKRRCHAHGGAPRTGAPKGNLNALSHGGYVSALYGRLDSGDLLAGGGRGTSRKHAPDLSAKFAALKQDAKQLAKDGKIDFAYDNRPASQMWNGEKLRAALLEMKNVIRSQLDERLDYMKERRQRDWGQHDALFELCRDAEDFQTREALLKRVCQFFLTIGDGRPKRDQGRVSLQHILGEREICLMIHSRLRLGVNA